ncbi:hypothetical protein [Streptomyces tardus]|nr:hypothetical protein [Streptomyces tardus]
MPHAEAFTPPPGPDVCLMQAGVTWDAVRVSAWVSRAVLPALGERSGAVLEDGYSGVWYWLIASGAGGGWRFGPAVQVLGAATWLAVPPVHRTERPGLRWVLAPGGGTRALTEPELLHAALQRQVGPR